MRQFGIGILLFWAIYATGQTAVHKSALSEVSKPLFNLSFNHLSRENGLSNNNANCLYSDSRGFLWIGTHNGLNRFDGSVCRTYKPYNSTITDVRIAAIKEDKNADLWISSETGLMQYIRKKDTFKSVSLINDGKKYAHQPLYIDNQNRIWVLILGRGIYVYDPQNGSSKLITNDISLDMKIPHQTFQSVTRIFYSGKEFGLNILTVKNDKIISKKTFFDGQNQPKINLNRYFFIENDSLAWVTKQNFGLIKLNYKTGKQKVYDTFGNKQTDVLTDIAFLPNSNLLFIGSNNLGLLVFDSKNEVFRQQFQHTSTTANSLKSSLVENIIIDKNLNIFVNLMGWGIDYANLKASNTQHWLTNESVQPYGIKSNYVNFSFVHKDKIFVKLQYDGSLILNTDGQILKHHKTFPLGDNIIYTSDSTMMATANGRVVLLNDDFEITKSIYIQNRNGLPENPHVIVPITTDEFLVGGASAIYSIKKTGQNYTVSIIEKTEQSEFRVNFPMYFDEPTQQLFVVSNWWTHFSVFKRKIVNGNSTWELQRTPQLNASIYNIIPDANHKQFIWFCTNMGLWKFNTQTHQYEIWDEAKGLPDNSVTTYIPEKNGDFWLITNRGISYYNKNFNVFKNFSEKDGATSSEYDWYGNFRLPNKRMMFGGTNGITVIKENPIDYNEKTQLYIKDLKVNEKSVTRNQYVGESEVFNLNSNENSFSIDFVGISFVNPQNLRLQYKLDDFEESWITTNNPAVIHYSNVPDGQYTFRLRALADNGQVVSTKSLNIIIEAPFWRTLWFRILVLLSVIGLIYMFYRYRINQLLQLQEVRNRISTDLHDEIGATLSGIGILSTIATQQIPDNHPAYHLLSRITSDAQGIGNSIDDIVWSINPKNDELANVIARIRRHADEMLDAKNIDYQIITPNEIDTIKLSMEQRRNIYLIFKESLNNLLKYANCTKASVEINIFKRNFTLVIQDNGVGFDTQMATQRNGLVNMKKRAKDLNATLAIISSVGNGTTIRLEMHI